MTGKISEDADVGTLVGGELIPVVSGGANKVTTPAGIKTYVKTGLAKADVGLGSVDNTADSAKAVLSATKLATVRTIDGQSFDGTASVTVIAPGTHAAASKATPVDADELPLVDSAASNVLKKLTWANLKAVVWAYIKTVILGVVSQSSGVPTGAIIERGSNSNGEYVKYADGTMICTCTVATTLAVATAYGAFFITATGIDQAFPATFAAQPVCYVSASKDSSVIGGFRSAFFAAVVTGTVTTYWPRAFLFEGISRASEAQKVFFLAVGRWF